MRRFALVLALAAVLAGCRTTAEINAVLASADALRETPEYRIGEGDVVTIRLLDDATEKYRVQEAVVRPDGKISFPEHGEVDVLHKTAAQVRSELEQGFRQTLGLKSPTVYVSVQSFASKSVTVIGEVEVPGRFPYTGNMRVSDLLGLARGIRETGAPNRALLFREVGKQPKVYHVHLADFLRKADFTTNYYLQPGDIVYVPLNGFSKLAQDIRVIVSPLGGALSFLNLGATTNAYFVP
jgi:polysaccharide export outer membrane protein